MLDLKRHFIETRAGTDISGPNKPVTRLGSNSWWRGKSSLIYYGQDPEGLDRTTQCIENFVRQFPAYEEVIRSLQSNVHKDSHGKRTKISIEVSDKQTQQQPMLGMYRVVLNEKNIEDSITGNAIHPELKKHLKMAHEYAAGHKNERQMLPYDRYKTLKIQPPKRKSETPQEISEDPSPPSQVVQENYWASQHRFDSTSLRAATFNGPEVRNTSSSRKPSKPTNKGR